MLDHALKQNGFHRWFGWPEATTRSSIGGAPKPLMAPRQDHKAAKIQANRIKKPLTIVIASDPFASAHGHLKSWNDQAMLLVQ